MYDRQELTNLFRFVLVPNEKRKTNNPMEMINFEKKKLLIYFFLLLPKEFLMGKAENISK